MSGDYNIPLESGLTYHIFNNGNNGENLFVEERNYTYFLRKYQDYIAPIADTFAWCLMPNHFHILVRFKGFDKLYSAFPERFAAPPSGIRHRDQLQTVEHSQYNEKVSESLSRQFADFFAGYARAINKAYQRNGKLFSLPFKRILVEHETYFEWLLTYIHRNPVHHGFCKDFADWPHSSFHEISVSLRNPRPVSTPSANSSEIPPPRPVSTPSANSSEIPQPRPVSTPSANRSILDLPFLHNWFGTYDDFARLHDASIQNLLDKRFWLE